MKHSKNDSPATGANDTHVPLESVLCTEELKHRSSRPPDYATENRALGTLVQALADSPNTILQTLAQTTLEVIRADSAGVSLLTEDKKRFYWPAIAGVWQPHIGGGTPRDFGPCGDVLDRNTPLMFQRFERRYAYFEPFSPPVEECLLVPFYVAGSAVGTIWAVTHDDRRKFEAEDLRQLESLGQFASAAYQTVQSIQTLKHREAALQQSHAALKQHAEELTYSNRLAVGRATRILDLKKEINDLCQRHGEPVKYTEIDPSPSSEGQV